MSPTRVCIVCAVLTLPSEVRRNEHPGAAAAPGSLPVAALLVKAPTMGTNDTTSVNEAANANTVTKGDQRGIE
jgi:hypothetical protein